MVRPRQNKSSRNSINRETLHVLIEETKNSEESAAISVTTLRGTVNEYQPHGSVVHGDWQMFGLQQPTGGLKGLVCSLAYELAATWRSPTFAMRSQSELSHMAGDVEDSTIDIIVVIIIIIICSDDQLTHFVIVACRPSNQWRSQVGSGPCARIPKGPLPSSPHRGRLGHLQRWNRVHGTPSTPYC